MAAADAHLAARHLVQQRAEPFALVQLHPDVLRLDAARRPDQGEPGEQAGGGAGKCQGVAVRGRGCAGEGLATGGAEGDSEQRLPAAGIGDVAQRMTPQLIEGVLRRLAGRPAFGSSRQ